MINIIGDMEQRRDIKIIIVGAGMYVGFKDIYFLFGTLNKMNLLPAQEFPVF